MTQRTIKLANRRKLPSRIILFTVLSVLPIAFSNAQSAAQTPVAQQTLTSDQAPTAQQKGLQIAQEVKSKDIGWGDSESELVMILRNKKGSEVVREMRSKSLEVEGDGDKGLTIFDTPIDVKGTVFLSFSHIDGQDDQWLYLPALKRVKRIASRNKSGPFLGSEFAFEDLSSFEIEKNTYLYLRDEMLDGNDSYVIEMRPLDKYSGYTRMVGWFDKAHYRMQKIDFYDRRDTLLKTLRTKDYQLYKDKYWRAGQSFMVNHKTGKSTDIEIKNLRFNVGLSDSDFNENRLQRTR